MSLLHCTSEGGPAAAQPPSVNQGQNPAHDLGTECQGLAVSSCRQQSVRWFAPAQATSTAPRLMAALLGLEQRAFVSSHVNKHNWRVGGGLLSTGKSFFKLGHMKPYTICINS